MYVTIQKRRTSQSLKPSQAAEKKNMLVGGDKFNQSQEEEGTTNSIPKDPNFLGFLVEKCCNFNKLGNFVQCSLQTLFLRKKASILFGSSRLHAEVEKRK